MKSTLTRFFQTIFLFPVFCFGSLNVNAQLHGTYTLDASKPASASNYTTSEDVQNDLMSGKRKSGIANGPGVSARFVINMANGAYDGLYLGNIKGTSAKNRIIFQSVGGDSSKVKLSAIFLDSTDYITIKEISIY